MTETNLDPTQLDAEHLRAVVRGRYAAATRQAAGRLDVAASSCCGSLGTTFGNVDPITRDLDDEAAQTSAGALAASLGCGNPALLADLQPGQAVLDLGSGGGLDVLSSVRRDPGVDAGSAGPVTVRAMTERDWARVGAIYEAGMATGHATFETGVPSWPDWDAAHLPGLRLVAVIQGPPGGGEVVGWAALSPVSDRCAYAGVAENSLYVDPAHRGRGVGQTLLRALIDQAEAAGIWTVQTGIFPENVVSLAVHQRCGFRVVGRRERLGRLNGVWRDVLFLEHRSPSIA